MSSCQKRDQDKRKTNDGNQAGALAVPSFADSQ
jgi:hypothetical protein